MKITVERDSLSGALIQIAAVVERRNTIPILSNVVFEAAGSELRLTATDLDLQLTTTMAALVGDEGSVTVAAHSLHDAIREVPAGSQVEIETVNDRVKISAGRARFKLPALPASDFPLMPALAAATSFEVVAEELSTLIRKVAFAQSSEQHRHYLCGVALMTMGGKGLHAVATDGHTVGVAIGPLPSGAEEMPDIILPTKLVTILTNFLTDHDGSIAMSTDGRKIEFEIGHHRLSSKLIDGTFPDWQRVIPSANSIRADVHVAGLTAALKRVTAISAGKVRAVKMSFTDDKLSLASGSPEAGLAEEEVPVALSGDPIEIGFNSRYLLRMMAASGGEELSIALADDRAPTLFTNPADPTTRWVVMPMRV